MSSVGKSADQKIADLENRLRNLESKAVADFVAADSFLKRNVNWVLPVAMLAAGFLGFELHG